MLEHNLYSSSSEELIDKRYRHFMFILYPEWECFNDIIFDIRSNFKRYCYIKHDPESSEKKEHYHLILSLDNARTIESICSRLKIPYNLCQPIRGLRGAIRYLVHKDSPDKIQYELTECEVSNAFSGIFSRAFDDLKTDLEKLDDIYSFVNEYSREYNSIEMEIQLTRMVEQNDYASIYKRYYNTIIKLIQCKCS